MPIEIHILQEGMGRVWVCRGVLTGKELIANNELILKSKQYEGVRWVLIDETETGVNRRAVVNRRKGFSPFPYRILPMSNRRRFRYS
ncbi:MAG: hypothetical protein WA254_11030 [Candidatus Sulfotelmatobacter sp.]